MNYCTVADISASIDPVELAELSGDGTDADSAVISRAISDISGMMRQYNLPLNDIEQLRSIAVPLVAERLAMYRGGNSLSETRAECAKQARLRLALLG